jgi:hypothetical protein
VERLERGYSARAGCGNAGTRGLTVDGRTNGLVLPVPDVLRVAVAVLLLGLHLLIYEVKYIAVAPVASQRSCAESQIMAVAAS